MLEFELCHAFKIDQHLEGSTQGSNRFSEFIWDSYRVRHRFSLSYYACSGSRKDTHTGLVHEHLGFIQV